MNLINTIKLKKQFKDYVLEIATQSTTSKQYVVQRSEHVIKYLQENEKENKVVIKVMAEAGEQRRNSEIYVKGVGHVPVPIHVEGTQVFIYLLCVLFRHVT